MTQKGGTFNFLIQDTKGQPQMVKVVQRNDLSQFKPVQNNVKIIKIPNAGEGNSQGSSMLRTVTLSGIQCQPKLMQLPIEALQCIQQAVKAEPVDMEDVEIDVPGATEEYEYEEVTQDEPVSSSSVAIKSEFPTARRSLAGTRRRYDSDNDHQPEYTTKRRKHADKVGKGLRHFSMKVCEKVRNKGFTSYNEVAEELVVELAAGMRGSASDSQNIRRRVYDALNVLMAMNIISKEKKEIRWLGLPTNSVQECNALEKEKQSKMERIQKKSQQLQELLIQLVSFKSLIERNKQIEVKGVKPSPSSAIHLPFIVVNTSDKALIDCSISNDKTEYMFNFNRRFQIHDDIDILKRMGLLSGLDKGECTETDIEHIKTMVPKSLENFVEQMGRGSVSNTLESILAEETCSYDEEDEDQDETEGQEQDGLHYSEDSNSDVDV